MPAPQRTLAAVSLAALAAVALSCSGGDNVTGNNGGRVLQPGLNLDADPAVIILDPNDPNAPRDPATQKLIGSSAIAAIVLGSDLSPTPGIPVTFTCTTGGTLGSAGAPVTTDAAGLAPDVLNVAEDGPALITVTATTPTESKTVDVVVDIAPTANAGADQTVNCPTPATLDGSASTDPNSTAGTNDDIVAFEWFVGQTKIADGEVTQATLPAGTHVVTLKVTDKAGATATDDLTVTVVDTTPPVVSLTMSPGKLWPPNHKLKNVQAILDIQDCDPAPTVQLVSVTSSEPDNGLGDGDTAGDIAGAALGTDDRTVQVRAERSGGGSGRVYTFVYRVTDASGNFTDATATVTVPHDQGH